VHRSFQTVSLSTWVNKGKKEGREHNPGPLKNLRCRALL
jgi:hypothetical protein